MRGRRPRGRGRRRGAAAPPGPGIDTAADANAAMRGDTGIATDIDADTDIVTDTTFALNPLRERGLEEVIRAARAPGSTAVWAELPPRDSQRAELEIQFGESLEGHRRVVNVSALRHAENRHGEGTKTANPIMEADLRTLPEIMSAPGASRLMPASGQAPRRVAHVRHRDG